MPPPTPPSPRAEMQVPATGCFTNRGMLSHIFHPIRWPESRSQIHCTGAKGKHQAFCFFGGAWNIYVTYFINRKKTLKKWTRSTISNPMDFSSTSPRSSDVAADLNESKDARLQTIDVKISHSGTSFPKKGTLVKKSAHVSLALFPPSGIKARQQCKILILPSFTCRLLGNIYLFGALLLFVSL